MKKQKTISAKLLWVIVALHVATLWIGGVFIEPFESITWWMFIVLPVVIFAAICWIRWQKAWDEIEPFGLNDKVINTITNIWFWLLFIISFGVVVGIEYNVGKLMLPNSPELHHPAIIVFLVMFSAAYLLWVFLMKNILKKIWDE